MKVQKKKRFNKNNNTNGDKTNTTQKVKTEDNNVEVFNIKISQDMIRKHNRKNGIKKRIDKRPLLPGVLKTKKEKPKFPGKAPVSEKALERHSRGEGMIGKGVKHPIHATKLRKKENKINYSLKQAARAEILLNEEQGYVEVEGNHKTTAISQKIIGESVDIAAASKIFDLKLDFGPYRAKYSRNGRHLLLGGKKGHLAAFDWVTKKLHCEINVMESIHDVSWLHVETMLAVAQKEFLHIYDNTGTELHCIKRIDKVLRMEFLPYHFLLATVNEYGFMSWLDISIGEVVGHYNNRVGRTTVMTQNPYNATLCVGSAKGVVSLWAPNVKDPLAKMLCHKTPITGIAVDNRGMYMATSGVDRSLKIWDIRQLDGPLQHYRLRSPPADLHFSQKDMLAVALGNVVEIYSDCCTKTVERPYLRHRMAKAIENFRFCPYEDVLGIGTSSGFASILVPGSGEPNFDALESNPFQTKTQRREAEVKALLDKIPAELITLNPYDVTEVDVTTLKEQMEAKKKLLHVKPQRVDLTPRKKNKGQSRIVRKKILKDIARKEFVDQSIEAQKLLDLPEQQPQTKQSFGVLNRFVSNPKTKKK